MKSEESFVVLNIISSTVKVIKWQQGA